MKRKITLLVLLLLFEGLGVAQETFTDTIPLVNLRDGQCKRILYSFEKKARKQGVISNSRPCLVEIFKYKWGKERWNITIENRPTIVPYRVIMPSRERKRLHPYKAAHQHGNCLFLFSFMDSSFMRLSGEYKVTDYTEYYAHRTYMFDTAEYPELAEILFEYQKNNLRIEDSLRNTVISVLNRGTIGPLMREWWNVGKRRMHKHDHVDIVPAKNDQVLYQDETLTIYYHKE